MNCPMWTVRFRPLKTKCPPEPHVTPNKKDVSAGGERILKHSVFSSKRRPLWRSWY